MDEDERRKLINQRTRLEERCDEHRREIARLESQGSQSEIDALRADISHLEERIDLINDELA